MEPRDGRVRQADAPAELSPPAIDVRVSSASVDGGVHLVRRMIVTDDEAPGSAYAARVDRDPRSATATCSSCCAPPAYGLAGGWTRSPAAR